ncbi:DUF6230 family protein [Paractinoplanes rhizophilus]|jgi:hypothetical protein|uniref:DUF6230 family protein n=1 Tax=Paractinoplanes rhizophilus TaxID=1416877 RepID=A0ABW2HNP3_9ACTN|nr:DUF6230 family protein [Actinoplanes sp.]
MTTPDNVPAGGVRWKRFGGMLALTGAVTAGLVALTASGVLAANFSISGMPFTVTATKLHGEGFEQFATLDQMIPDSPNQGDTGGQMVLIVSAIDRAELTRLCQSVSLGGINLKITAGDAGTDVSARALVVDSDLISGDADFQRINVGQDASTFDKVTDPATGKVIKGGEGVFGQQADTVDIANLRQNNYATTAARFTLPHLRMAFTGDGC